MNNHAITITGLGQKYGTKWAVKDLNLTVPTGSVYGFLGPNGAGKSTTIKMLMGLLPQTEGQISVLGQDPFKDGISVRQRVGYVPENYGFYEWMRVDEQIALIAPYHPTWNWDVCNELQADFKLQPNIRIREMSKGMKAKLALLLALSHEPEILVLDEPTGGLDPAARRNFIETILSRFQETGKTILVSSHLLNEFSGLLDYAAFMADGKLGFASSMDELHKRFKRARLIFDGKVPKTIHVENTIRVHTNGREAVLTCKSFDPQKTEAALSQTGASRVMIEEMTLEDIFVDMVES